MDTDEDKDTLIAELTELLDGMNKRSIKTTRLMNMAADEFRVIHALCDRAECPRFFNGEKLSASQRVTALEMAYRDIRYLYRGEAPPLPQ